MEKQPSLKQFLGTQSRLEFKPLLLLCIPLAATTPLYPPNQRMLVKVFSEQALIEVFALALMLTCLLLAALLTAFSLRHTNWTGFSVPLSGSAALVYLGAQAGFYVCLLLGASTLLVAALGVVSGLCFVPVALSWLASFSVSFRNVMLHGALICLGSALLTALFSILPALVALLGMLVLLIPAVAAPLFDRSNKPLAAPLKSDETPRRAQGAASVKDFFSVVWLPFLGLLIYVFLTSSFSFELTEGISTEVTGSILAGVIIIVLCVPRHQTPLVILIETFIIPALIALSIVLRSFEQGSLLFMMGAATVLTPMIFLAVFALSSLVVVSQAREFPAPAVLGVSSLLGTVALLLGMAMGSIVTPSSEGLGTALWITICIYFALVICNLGYRSWRRAAQAPGLDGLVDETAQKDAETRDNARDQRLQELAALHGLTVREREFMGYLGYGYGSSFIAKSLFISNNTARTHIRNIYRKLGVGSREEFLALISQRSEGQGS